MHDSLPACDQAHMARALRLARRGLFSTHPNPRVGCVIVAAHGGVRPWWLQGSRVT